MRLQPRPTSIVAYRAGKMSTLRLIVACFAALHLSDAGILLCSRHSLPQIPSLKSFGNADLDELNLLLDHPKNVAFQSDSVELMRNVTRALNFTNTAYAPTSDVDFAKVEGAVFNVAEGDDAEGIEEVLRRHLKSEENVLVLLVLAHEARTKRDVKADGSPTEVADYETPRGPVLYNADGEAMVYSSRPPVLRTNTSSLVLGKALTAMLAEADRLAPRKLVVTIPFPDSQKIILRFRFPWLNGYWTLNALEMVYTDGKTYVLNITREVGAPRHFSYHCFGKTVFRDAGNDMELILYEMQAQPDSRYDSRFDDALDCVPFTTAPIWSGLLVVVVLLQVLYVGLAGLSCIKSMDKFDNQKTKQLSVSLTD